jgi:transposase
MPGKPKKLTDGQIERARKLVEDGYLIRDIARRFGVSVGVLNNYGIRQPPPEKKGRTGTRLPPPA